MAETVGKLFLKARAILNQYTEDGAQIVDDMIDIQNNFILYADMAHKELYKIVNTDGTIPKELTSINDTLDIGDMIAQGIVLDGVAKLAPYINKDLATLYEAKYDVFKRDPYNHPKATETNITDSYPIGSGE